MKMISLNSSDITQFTYVLLTSILIIFVAYINVKHQEYLHYFTKIDHYIRLFMSVSGFALVLICVLSIAEFLKYDCTVSYILIDGEYSPFMQLGILSCLAFLIVWISWLVLPNTRFLHTDSIIRTLYKVFLFNGVIVLTLIASMVFVFDYVYLIDVLETEPSQIVKFCAKAFINIPQILNIYMIFCLLVPGINELFIYRENKNKEIEKDESEKQSN